jgi:hypothetical protein
MMETELQARLFYQAEGCNWLSEGDERSVEWQDARRDGSEIYDEITYVSHTTDQIHPAGVYLVWDIHDKPEGGGPTNITGLGYIDRRNG